MATFRKKILTGVSWSTLSSVTTQVTNLAVFAILDKYYLEPSEFGLVAMIMILTGFASTFTEFGLGAALIQKPDIKESHKSSFFWLSLTLGFFAFICLFALRGKISDFFGQPVLQDMIGPMAFTLVLAAASSVPGSLLRKDLKFKAITIVSMSADITSMIFAIALASQRAGPWALIGKTLILQLVYTLGIWIVCPWHPKLIFCFHSIRETLNFGLSFFGTRTFGYVVAKMDQFMIGKFVGDTGLGLYSSGFKITLAPVALIKNQIVGVFFPALSSIQNDKRRTKAIVLKLSGLLAATGFPCLFFIVVESGDLIRCFLDARWGSMQLMLILLSFTAMAEISIFPGVIFLSQGKAAGYLWLILWTKSISSIGIIVGVTTNGIIGLLIGSLVAAILNFLPYVYFPARLIDMRVKDQLLVNLAPFLISASAASLIVFVAPIVTDSLSNWGRLVANTIIYVGIVGIFYMVVKPFPLKQFIARQPI